MEDYGPHEPAADKRHWLLPADVFDDMIEALDRPISTDRLVDLFKRPSPFKEHRDCE